MIYGEIITTLIIIWLIKAKETGWIRVQFNYFYIFTTIQLLNCNLVK